jgi:lipopolysaccharide export system permease protein
MSPILLRYVARTYLASFAGILAAGLAIFLVADFVDRASMYVGPHWVVNVAILYWYKALVAIRQLAPAALLLAAGTSISILRKRGELTAMSALTVGPTVLYAPIAVCALALAAGLVAFDEWVVVKAARRVDEIHVTSFGRWGDWRFFFSPQKWFRRQDRIFYLRSGDTESGFSDVTVFRLTPDFQIAERIDAQRLTYLGGTRWALDGVVERRFPAPGHTQLRVLPHAEYDLQTTERPFRIRRGRPEQMRIPELREQIRARREGGLSTSLYALALHNRFAYPLAGLPAALLAAGFALRPGRKGHLTASIVEGVVVAVVLWGMMVILRTLATAQHVSAPVAAWAPFALLAVGGMGIWLRREGWLQRAAMSRR